MNQIFQNNGSDSVYESVAYDLVKTKLSEPDRKQKRKN